MPVPTTKLRNDYSQSGHHVVIQAQKNKRFDDNFTPLDTYCSKSVLLAVLSVMSLIPFSAGAELNANQNAALDGLLSVCELNPSSPLCQRYSDIVQSSGYGGPITICDCGIEQLNDLIPDEVAAQGSAAVDFGFRQLNIIHGRIINLRKSKKHESLLLGSLTSVLGGAAGDDREQLRDDPLGFFVKGQFNVGEKDQTLNEQGYENDRQAVTLGLDYTFSDALVLGASFGYGSTHTDFNNNKGRMDADAFDFATYGSYFMPMDFYVDWIFSYGSHDYDVRRTVNNTTAKSKPEGDQYGFSLGVGNDIAIRSFVINPYLRFEYLKTDIGSYVESGGAGFGLEVGKQALDSLTTTLGAQISQSISLPWGVLSPGVRAEWVHQYKDNNRLIQTRFSAADSGSGNFVVATDSPDRNYFNLGGSLALTLPEGRAAFLRYEYRLGQEAFSDHTVELGARIPF